MNRERFQALAAAYGGAISRWPTAERGTARWFAFCHRRASGDILREARRLDWALDRSETHRLGDRLQELLTGSAHGLVEVTRETPSWVATCLGTGLVAACAAGIGAGFLVAPLTANDWWTSSDPVEVAASALGNPTELGDA